MIELLSLRTFKCFKEVVLPLNPLTLLSGSNGSGKSSVLQALLLIHQTMREHEWSDRLVLNGDAIKAGSVQDIVDKVHGRRRIDIVLGAQGLEVQWTFHGDRTDLAMEVEQVVVNGKTYERPEILHYLLPKGREDTNRMVKSMRDLTYLTAERLGPREVYSLKDRQVARVVGPRGENTASVLHRIKLDPVRESFLVNDVAPTGLKQTVARMGGFFPGCDVDVQLVPQANAVTLGLRNSDATDFHRPIHVGFGLTQVLPIVVAAVAAREGDILMIENPEVHLHPAGQTKMGIFLSEVAASGVQVLVETHSDHVLNGIRRAVRGKHIKPQDVTLYFFRERGQELGQVDSPGIDPEGRIEFWPDGFFDQFDKDMTHFAGWGT